MNRIHKNISFVLILLTFCYMGLQQNVCANQAESVKSPAAATESSKDAAISYIALNSPLLLVNNPTYYLNKYVEFNAKFNKFSSIGLDYSLLKRDSKTYTGILIQRDDISDYVIPLSELKMFMKISDVTKLVDLTSGDKIKIKGKVFSTALGDPWLDINELTILEHVKKDNSDK